MTGRNLWYIRRDGKVAGPFPSQVVTNHLLLGRVRPIDEVSTDQLVWQPLLDVRELIPHELLELQTATDPEQRQWLEERLKAARRWADERLHEQSHEQPKAEERGDREVWSEERRAAERAARGEGPDYVPGGQRKSPSYLVASVIMVGVLLAVGVGAFYFRASTEDSIKVDVNEAPPQCAGKAAAGINWSGCDKQNIRLRGAELSKGDFSYTNFAGADLSGSRLRQAKLTGATLAAADLNHTDLSGADLSYSDLRGANLLEANLEGAVLDNAIWQDGRECGEGSLGQCR